MRIPVLIKILHEKARIPTRQTEGASGYDLHAAMDESIVINPGRVQLIPTGISLSIPCGYEVQIRPRSGLSVKERLIIINSPGTIDSDYRGEIFVPLYNISDSAFIVEPGLRLAQIILAKIETIEWNEVQTLDPTTRGEGGFGSSGRF